MMAEDKIVAQFKRNPTEEVRAGIKEFKGRTYIDIRIYYMDDQGDWKPTRKGVSLATDFMPELRNAVDSIEKELESMEGDQ
ncbi:MAG: transcriptional coactivator p15/PC4 family protein [Polyangia bacterium]